MYGKFKSEYPAECRELIVKMGENNVMSLCRQITLSHLDHHWSDYLLAIAEIRDGIHLRRLGKQDPLYEFQKLAIEMFDRLLTDFETDAMHSMSSLAGKDSIPESVLKTPSATWTYLVNDDPWEDKFEMKFIGDIGFSFGAALQMPLLLLYFAFKKMLKRKQGQH